MSRATWTPEAGLSPPRFTTTVPVMCMRVYPYCFFSRETMLQLVPIALINQSPCLPSCLKQYRMIQGCQLRIRPRYSDFGPFWPPSLH